MIETRQDKVAEIGLLELLLAVAKRKRKVLLFTLAAALLAAAVCFIIPLKWESRSLISPIADNTSSLQIGAELFSSLSSMPLVTSLKQDMAVEFLTEMDSRSFREDIIRKFDLIPYFRINETDSAVAMEKALIKFDRSVMRTRLEPQSNTIAISVFSRDRFLSRNINAYIIKSLEHYIRYQKKVRSRLTREFLDIRTSEVKAQIDTLLVMVKRFEMKGRAVSLSEQTTQALALYSDLVAQKMANDIELELARQQYGENSPKVAELESKDGLLAGKIRDFEDNHSGSLPAYLPQLKNLPEVNWEYSGFRFRLQVLQQVYGFLYPMLEAARLAEMKEMPAVETVDTPSLAGLHTYPKRLLLIVVSFLAALLLASLAAILAEFMSAEQKSHLRAILLELTGRGNSRFGDD